MKDFDEKKFVDDLSRVPWGTVDVFDDIDDRFSAFWNLFLQVIDEHCPIKKVKIKNKQDKPWYNNELRRLTVTRNLIRKESGRDNHDRWKHLVKLIKKKSLNR